MLFNSYTFIIVFLPLVLLGYQLLGLLGFRRIVIAWLVLASLFYYGWWNPSYLILLILSILVNYLIGRILLAIPNKREGRPLLIGGIAANLLVLGYYKYTVLLIESLNLVVGSSFDEGGIVLPLAISFYTFQQIAFLVDAYRDKVKYYSFLDYVLFVTFFPQLIAGPIVHHSEMLPQFEEKQRYRLKADQVAAGSALFLIGLGKKVLVADTMAGYATPIFALADSGADVEPVEALIGSLSYGFQIYFDFSGYTDMAIGIAWMLGIQLPFNFDSPYKARNISEFWRCWHMTLSRFLRDYLYIPLGGNRKGEPRRYVNLMVTMLLGGLWHGAGWTFVAWGGIHGIYLSLHHGWSSIAKYYRWKWNQHWAWQVVAVLLTNLAVLVAWIFFRAETFSGASQMIGELFEFGNLEIDWEEESQRTPLIWIIALSLVCWFLPNSQQLLKDELPAMAGKAARSKVLPPFDRIKWTANPAWAIVLALVLITCFLMMGRISEFIYYQF